MKDDKELKETIFPKWSLFFKRNVTMLSQIDWLQAEMSVEKASTVKCEDYEYSKEEGTPSSAG